MQRSTSLAILRAGSFWIEGAREATAGPRRRWMKQLAVIAAVLAISRGYTLDPKVRRLTVTTTLRRGRGSRASVYEALSSD
jgi:hypothetical protein